MTGSAIITIGVQDDNDLPLLNDTDHFEQALRDGLEAQEMADEVRIDNVDFVEEAETVIIQTTCDPNTSANYALKPNAMGLETDLHYALSAGLDHPMWFTSETDVLRGTFCDHPQEGMDVKEKHPDEHGPVEWAECGGCGEALPVEAAYE